MEYKMRYNLAVIDYLNEDKKSEWRYMSGIGKILKVVDDRTSTNPWAPPPYARVEILFAIMEDDQHKVVHRMFAPSAKTMTFNTTDLSPMFPEWLNRLELWFWGCCCSGPCSHEPTGYQRFASWLEGIHPKLGGWAWSAARKIPDLLGRTYPWSGDPY
jgi:hypothetical protein